MPTCCRAALNSFRPTGFAILATASRAALLATYVRKSFVENSPAPRKRILRKLGAGGDVGEQLAARTARLGAPRQHFRDTRIADPDIVIEALLADKLQTRISSRISDYMPAFENWPSIRFHVAHAPLATRANARIHHGADCMSRVRNPFGFACPMLAFWPLLWPGPDRPTARRVRTSLMLIDIVTSE